MLRTDFQNIEDGSEVVLYPNKGNPLHKKPVTAHYTGGYFYCAGTRPEDGPDYYLGDVLKFNEGFAIP